MATPSIAMIPSGYKDGKVYSVLPNSSDGDFNFTRGSAATRVNAQGLVENVQIISSELVSNGDFSQEGNEKVTNGGFDTDSNWDLGTGWTISGGSANYDGVNAYELLRQGTANGVVGKTYLVKYDVINNSGVGGVYAKFGGVNLSSYNQNNGSFEFYITAVSTDYIRFTPQSNFNGSIDNISVKEVGQDWSLGTGWSIGNNVANAVNAPFGSQLVDSTTLTASKKYSVSFVISNYIQGSVRVGVGNVFSSDISANGSYTFILTTANTNAFKVQARGGGSGTTLSVSNVSVKEITDDTDLPRLDYSDGSCPSLLLEPQSTNLIPYSEDFSDASYSKASGGLGSVPIVTSNYSTSPSGEQNADRIQFDLNGGTSGSDSSWIFTFPSSDVDGVVSIYLKTNDNSTKVVYFRNTFGTIDNVTVNGNWQRYSITNPTTRGFYLGLRGSQGNSDSADLSVWGSQVEVQSYATSYIPTNGSIATRLADQATGSGNSSLINSTEGVLYAEIAANANSSTNRTISINNGSATDYLFFRYRVNNRFQIIFRSGNNNTVNETFDLSNNLDFNKIAFSYKLNEFKIFVNGVQIGSTITSGVVFGTTINSLDFNEFNGTNKFYGKVKAIAVYKEALTDAELQELTTI
jgi:hypothetical protein